MSYLEPTKDELDLLSKKMGCKLLDYYDFGKAIRLAREKLTVFVLYSFISGLIIGIVAGMS